MPARARTQTILRSDVEQLERERIVVVDIVVTSVSGVQGPVFVPPAPGATRTNILRTISVTANAKVLLGWDYLLQMSCIVKVKLTKLYVQKN